MNKQKIKVVGRSDPDTREGSFQLKLDNVHVASLQVGQSYSLDWDLHWADARRNLHDLEGSFKDVYRRLANEEMNLTKKDFSVHVMSRDRKNDLNFFTFDGLNEKKRQELSENLRNAKKILEYDLRFGDKLDVHGFYQTQGAAWKNWGVAIEARRELLPTPSLLEWVLENHIHVKKLKGRLDLHDATEKMKACIDGTFSPPPITHLVLWDGRTSSGSCVYLVSDLASPYGLCTSLEDARQVVKYRMDHGQRDVVLTEILLNEENLPRKTLKKSVGSSGDYFLVQIVEAGRYDDFIRREVFKNKYDTFTELKYAFSNVKVPEGWDDQIALYGVKALEVDGQALLF